MPKTIAVQLDDDLLKTFEDLKRHCNYRNNSVALRALIIDSQNKLHIDKLRRRTFGAYAPSLKQLLDEGDKPITLDSHVEHKEINVDKINALNDKMTTVEDQLNGLLWSVGKVQDNQNSLIALQKIGGKPAAISKQQKQLLKDVDTLHDFVTESKKTLATLRNTRVN